MQHNSDKTTLCLACSSSLPPSRSQSSISGLRKSFSDVSDGTFYTQCCKRPICPSCLASNPRLARYNPCLHCLGGVAVVRHSEATSSMPSLSSTKGNESVQRQNIDGGVHDEDVFVLGDEEEDEDELLRDRRDLQDRDYLTGESSCSSSSGPSTPPPPYEENGSAGVTTVFDKPDSPDVDSKPPESQTAPAKYNIKPADTLLGISLKYGINGRLLCRLNGLPPSTLSTTPHLLHTRTYLTFPPTVQKLSSLPPLIDPADAAAREARRARERAEKRLQTLTKEVDWRVAKAYVALAEHDEGDENVLEGAIKEQQKETKQEKKMQARDPFTGIESNLEARAIGRYLDDDDWEQSEQQAGRAVSLPRFPLFEAKGKSTATRRWWKLGS